MASCNCSIACAGCEVSTKCCAFTNACMAFFGTGDCSSFTETVPETGLVFTTFGRRRIKGELIELT
jgi:hypothetical protein